MSSFGVFIEKIGVFPHPNADRLELAKVGLYNAVVQKDQFVDGEYALYIPEQSMLPEWLIAELNLEGKLAGPEKNRVKAVKLRQTLSQGIAASLDVLGKIPESPVTIVNPEDHLGEEFDFAEALGITKWKPEIPIHMSGDMMREPNLLLQWTDMENIQRYPQIFEDGEHVVLTEKIHGTCLISTMFFDEGLEPGAERIAVVSKGLAGKGISFAESETNLYWRAVKDHAVRELATEIKDFFEAKGHDVVAVGVYGEVFGAGIQDLTYGAERNKPQFRVFDAQVRFADRETQWVNTHDLRAMTTNIEHVPMLWEGAFDIEKVAEIASGKEQVSGTETNMREGVVIRPLVATSTWGFSNPRRKIAKFVTEEYLMRKNGTEFN